MTFLPLLATLNAEREREREERGFAKSGKEEKLGIITGDKAAISSRMRRDSIPSFAGGELARTFQAKRTNLGQQAIKSKEEERARRTDSLCLRQT